MQSCLAWENCFRSMAIRKDSFFGMIFKVDKLQWNRLFTCGQADKRSLLNLKGSDSSLMRMARSWVGALRGNEGTPLRIQGKIWSYKIWYIVPIGWVMVGWMLVGGGH